MKKRIICGLFVLLMALSVCGAAQPVSDLGSALEELGFEKHGDLWIVDAFTTGPDKSDYYIVGYYDPERNYGSVSSKSVALMECEDSSLKGHDAFDYISFCYDYQKEDFVILDAYAYRY